MSMRRFKNQAVHIAGGTSGIGYATAKKFLQENAIVAISGKDWKKTDKAVDKLKKYGRVFGESRDWSKEEGTILRPRILVNCVGLCKVNNFIDISLEEWHRVIDNNLTSCFTVCKAGIPWMLDSARGGIIINVASIAGRSYSKSAGIHYTVAKAGIIAFTKHLAAELADHNIRVNAVCPGPTKTRMLDGLDTEEIKKGIPMGCIAKPEQIADVILFLASEEASYMTGAIVDVAGGHI